MLQPIWEQQKKMKSQEKRRMRDRRTVEMGKKKKVHITIMQQNGTRRRK